jgi:hypothetical protein
LIKALIETSKTDIREGGRTRKRFSATNAEGYNKLTTDPSVLNHGNRW